MAETEAEAQSEDGGDPKDKDLARRASRAIRRARRLYRDSDWQPSAEASFLVQEAQVLALMDLAEAVRESHRAAD
jgi:hypothetical protein